VLAAVVFHRIVTHTVPINACTRMTVLHSVLIAVPLLSAHALIVVLITVLITVRVTVFITVLFTVCTVITALLAVHITVPLCSVQSV
jgi:hypothetical protein